MHPISRSLNRLRFVACLCFMFAASHPAIAADPLLKSHVDDQVQILGSNHASIERKLTELESSTGYKVIMMTRDNSVKYGSGDALGIKEFADLKMSKKDKDNAVLFLFVSSVKAINLQPGANLKEVINNPASQKAIEDSLTAVAKYEEEGPRLERTVDEIIRILKPGIVSSLIHPRTVPWALLSLALSAALLFGLFLAVKKIRSAG